MSKLPALVSALAECDGRPRETLEHIARVVREAGYIPTTKRGSGAAEMTSREIANLILGANGADSPKDAPLAIDRFRSLRLHDCFLQHGERSLETFKRISETQNFGEALELLIDGTPDVIAGAFNFYDEGYADERLRHTYREALLQQSWNRSVLCPFALTIALHRYAADIVCEVCIAPGPTEYQEDPHWRTEFKAEFRVDGNRLLKGFYGGDPWSDRRVVVEITGYTLFFLWLRVLADDDIPSVVRNTMAKFEKK